VNKSAGRAALCLVVVVSLGVAPAAAQTPTPDPAPVPAPAPAPVPPPAPVTPTHVATTTSSHPPAAKRKVAKREKPVKRLAHAYSARLHAPDETGSAVPVARTFTDPAATIPWDSPTYLIAVSLIVVGLLGITLVLIGLIAAPALAGILHRPARAPQGPGVRRSV
jgi:hypothetical protein